MLQPANTFNPQVPMNSTMNQMTPFPPSPTGGAQTPMQAPQMPNPMNQTMGNPQTQSFAHGGRTRKRSKMIPVHVSKSELAEMVEAQGEAEHDKHDGRHVFKKLGKFLEHPHIAHAVRAKFAQGGGMSSLPSVMDQARSLGMHRPGFADGGHVAHESNGRNGDTEVVYIPHSMQKLLDSSGRGSINEHDGKPEYFGLSDIWGGIKSLGSSALGALNSAAPMLAQVARPLAAKLPGGYGIAANAALDAAPNLINSLNNSVNNQNNPDPTQGPDWGAIAPQLAAHGVNAAASRFNNPMVRGAQAGAQSYLNNQNFSQGMGNAFNAATAHMPNNPMMDTMRAGSNALQEQGNFGAAAGAMGQRAMQHAPQMAQQLGQQAMQRMPERMQSALGPMMGNMGNNQNRQKMESQYLDQLYNKPSYA